MLLRTIFQRFPGMRLTETRFERVPDLTFPMLLRMTRAARAARLSGHESTHCPNPERHVLRLRQLRGPVPQVFALDYDSNRTRIVPGAPLADYAAEIAQAASECPTQAIHVVAFEDQARASHG